MKLETTDKELEIREAIDQILDGNLERFEIIYENYYKMTASIIRRILKPKSQDLESMINEAFLIIFKSLKGFKGESKFSTYIYRIVLNYAFKISKKQSKDKQHIVVWNTTPDNQYENLIENIPSSENTENKIIDAYSLENAIRMLSKDLQETVDLYYYEDYPIKDIAKILGSSESAIKNRLYQARNKIKTELIKGNAYHE